MISLYFPSAGGDRIEHPEQSSAAAIPAFETFAAPTHDDGLMTDF